MDVSPTSAAAAKKPAGPTGRALPMARGPAVEHAPDRPTTIGEGGSRRWVYTAGFSGMWQRRRDAVYLLLMAIFFALPWTYVGGHQTVLFDVPGRRLALFGLTLWPTDTLLFWMLMSSFFVAVFFFTAQWGRVWCGWACPQTVFLEGVFRRVEAWFEGDRNARMKLDKAPWTFGKLARKLGKHAAFAVIAGHVANTFICYFVGSEKVVDMTLRPPLENPGWFAFMFGVGAVFYLDFAWFREQLCVVACPYGRWQSVLLDEHSLIVGYDPARGEPRGKVRARKPEPDAFGDCVDCNRCVDVCPTGIDIRHGLQMECVNCTACIDACDAVMDRTGRPRGLIRYTSLNQLAGKPRRVVRARTIGYGIALAAAVTAFVLTFALRPQVEVQVLRGAGRSAQVVDGLAINHLRAKVLNKTDADVAIHVRAPAGFTLEVPHNPWPIERGGTVTMEIFVQREAKLMPARGEMVLLTFELDGKVIHEREVRIFRR